MNKMTKFEIISTLIALLAVFISSISLIRSREIAQEQKKIGIQSNRIAAQVALIEEYRIKIKMLEIGLENGTIEKENLSRTGMERVLEEYEDKLNQTLKDLYELHERDNGLPTKAEMEKIEKIANIPKDLKEISSLF